MKTTSTLLRTLLALALLAPATFAPLGRTQTTTSQPSAAPAILNREQAQAYLPEKVFYRGQSASVQGRNSAGLKLSGDKLVLFAIVDNSGYSTAVQQTYQAYLLTEVTLNLGGQSLKPGAYGFGFIGGNKMVIMDIGANELMRTDTIHDESVKRPNPLQVLASPHAGEYRLYLGRNYVAFRPSEK